MSQDKELFDEWASGASVANATGFFEEIPLELDKPENFQVTPEQIPDVPAAQPVVATQTPAVDPVPVQTPEPENESEVVQLEGGGTITIEKNGRGWKAVLDSEVPNIKPENFYGNNKTQLIANLAKGKLEASKAILRLKKEKLLGGDEKALTPKTPPISREPITAAPFLTADEVIEIKNKLQDNPVEAIDLYLQKRFGREPQKLAEALNVADEAKSIVTAQMVKSEVEEVNQEFIRDNPDFAQEYSSPENVNKLIARMAKVYLHKKVGSNPPQAVVDSTIYELYMGGFWTSENLGEAKEELLDGGLLDKVNSVSSPPQPPPQQVAAPPQSVPSAPDAPRIATQTGQSQPVGLGLPARASNPSPVQDDKPLSDVDLQKMPLSDLRLIAAAQLKQMRQQ